MRFTLKTISMIFINLLLVYFLASCSKRTNTIAIGKSTIDSDSDGITDDRDNCFNSVNPLQEDADTDGVGDICDNCIDKINQDQADDDGDGIGNVCEDGSGDGDEDKDKDGVSDESDNCPDMPNPNQLDYDADGVGMACDEDEDRDSDEVLNSEDNCPDKPNTDQADTDDDNIGDVCDNCPNVASSNQEDEDMDSIGDVCDSCDDRIDINDNGIGDQCEIKSWVHPRDLNDNISSNEKDVYFAEVAMDDNGSSIIVWGQVDDNNNYQIFKSEYRNGMWNPALTAKISFDGPSTFEPKVAMSNNGDAIIVWTQNDGVYSQIFMSEYRNGEWIYPKSLGDNISPDNQDAESPQVAMDDSGNAIIVWVQSDGVYNRIFKSEYRNGEWIHPTSNESISPTGQHALFPQVTMDSNGHAIIAWFQSDGAKKQIFKSEYRGVNWEHPSSLTDNISPDGQNASVPRVAMDNNGNTIIVWVQNDGLKNQIFKSEYRGVNWEHPSLLIDNISPDGQHAGAPQIAMDDNGNAIIVWVQKDGVRNQIFKSECRAGVWSDPLGLYDNISAGELPTSAPEVAMDDYGSAIVTWLEKDENNIDQIFKSEFRNGSWITPLNSSDNISPDSQTTLNSEVAMDKVGHALIVWSQNDGTKYQIFKSEYR